MLVDADGWNWKRVTVSPSVPLAPGEGTVWGYVQLTRASTWLVFVLLLAMAQAVALGVALVANESPTLGVLTAFAALGALSLLFALFATAVASRGVRSLTRDAAFLGAGPAASIRLGTRAIALGGALLVPQFLFSALLALVALSAGQGDLPPADNGAVATVSVMGWAVLAASCGAAALLAFGAQFLVSGSAAGARGARRSRFLAMALGGAAASSLAFVSFPALSAATPSGPLAALEAIAGVLGALLTTGSTLIYREQLDDAAHEAYGRVTRADPPADAPEAKI